MTSEHHPSSHSAERKPSAASDGREVYRQNNSSALDQRRETPRVRDYRDPPNGGDGGSSGHRRTNNDWRDRRRQDDDGANNYRRENGDWRGRERRDAAYRESTNNSNWRDRKEYDGDAGSGERRNDSNRGFKRRFDPWRLPDRWNDYTTVGKVIPEARIISFKTPLKAEFFTKEGDPFEVKDLLQKVSELGGELGLVVDLTYTTRYYDPSELTSNNIEYKKILCPGRDFEELERMGAEFVETVKEFFARNKDNDKWVGVHCTHGLNRTGYLVCRYLHEALGWSIDESIEKFQDARGHPIERKEYLSELKKLTINA